MVICFCPAQFMFLLIIVLFSFFTKKKRKEKETEIGGWTSDTYVPIYPLQKMQFLYLY